MNKHTSQGGTGIHNFSEKVLSVYTEAIRRSGGEQVFCIHNAPIEGLGSPLSTGTRYYSLHWFNRDLICNEKLNAFARAYKEVQLEHKEAEERREQEVAKKQTDILVKELTEKASAYNTAADKLEEAKSAFEKAYAEYTDANVRLWNFISNC